MIQAKVLERGFIGGRRRRGRRAQLVGSSVFRRGTVVEYDDPPELPSLPGNAGVKADAFTSAVRERRGVEVEEFFRGHLGIASQRTSLTWSIRRHCIEALESYRSGIGVLQKVNNSRWVNKYFRAVNARLETGGVFAGCAEVNGQRKERIFRKYPAVIAHVLCVFDFILHRLFPKIPVFKKCYFAVTRGHNRSLAAPEVLGRLVSCGFAIIEHREIGGLMYFAARKIREAEFVPAPTYGPFCALRRVGRGGNMITVYKFRTMHPYAEFLQDYIYRCNNLEEGGKFKDDFRVTPWGKWLRRLWLDELPMLLNLLKGEVKLVGVRPLSRQYFNLYPPELQEERVRHTPGLLPPFCADTPRTFDEIVSSELRYLRSCREAPVRTDLRYFLVSVWNIFAKKVTSA